jgi:hypothetical protein
MLIWTVFKKGRLIECWLLIVRWQIFLSYSGRLQVPQYILKKYRNKGAMG